VRFLILRVWAVLKGMGVFVEGVDGVWEGFVRVFVGKSIALRCKMLLSSFLSIFGVEKGTLFIPIVGTVRTDLRKGGELSGGDVFCFC